MSLKDADQLTPDIHLSNIIHSLSPSDVKTNRIIVASPSYMKTLTSILAKTSREELQTYFVWKVIQSYASVIEADELKPYSRFRNDLQGKVRSGNKDLTHLTDQNRILTLHLSVGESV
jgi:endothelin-converting enzyme